MNPIFLSCGNNLTALINSLTKEETSHSFAFPIEVLQDQFNSEWKPSETDESKAVDAGKTTNKATTSTFHRGLSNIAPSGSEFSATPCK